MWVKPNRSWYKCSSELYLRDGEIDNGRVFLHKEVVLGESFDAEDEVWRQFGQLEPFEKILFVGFVLLKANDIEMDA